LQSKASASGVDLRHDFEPEVMRSHDTIQATAKAQMQWLNIPDRRRAM
jgi:hypothetical protein